MPERVVSDTDVASSGGSGLSDGDDFDGQGTSQFSNLQSVDSERLSNTIYAESVGDIQTALDKAEQRDGRYRVVVDGQPDGLSNVAGSTEPEGWLISSPITIPSNTVLDIRSYVLLDVDSNCNIITNKSAYSGDSVRDDKIHLTGTGWIDGNASNQTRQNDQYLNNGIHFYKVDELYIDGLDAGPTNAWCWMIEDCKTVRIWDIGFWQDSTTANQDGLNIFGSKDVIGHGFRGRAEDDVFGVKSTDVEGFIGSPKRCEDIYLGNAIVEGGDSSSVNRTYAESGSPIRNVTIENVVYRSNTDVFPGVPQDLLRFGYSAGLPDPSPSEHENFTFKNILAEGFSTTQSVLDTREPGQNFTFENIVCETDGGVAGMFAWDDVTFKNCTFTTGTAAFRLRGEPCNDWTIQNTEIDSAGRIFDTANAEAPITNLTVTGCVTYHNAAFFRSFDNDITRLRINDTTIHQTGNNYPISLNNSGTITGMIIGEGTEIIDENNNGVTAVYGGGPTVSDSRIKSRIVDAGTGVDLNSVSGTVIIDAIYDNVGTEESVPAGATVR